MKYAQNILETIGNTPLIKLNTIIEDIEALVLAKVESFNPGNPNRTTIDGNLVGDERGTGEDYGIRFSLMENRLSLNVAYYETSSSNRLTFNREGNVSDAIDAIWEVTDPSRIIDGGNASTESLVSDGIEIELIANINEYWSILANMTKSDTVTSDLFAKNRAYVEANRSALSTNLDAATVDGSLEYSTVREALAYLDNEIATFVDPFNGRSKLGHSDTKFNVFTNYRFSEDSPLSGFSIGGGARYFSEPIVGYSDPDANGNSTTYKGDSNLLFDLKIGYKTKIMNDRVDWSIQLNIRNLLDNDDLLPTLTGADGTVKRYRFQDPREFVLTSSFRF